MPLTRKGTACSSQNSYSLPVAETEHCWMYRGFISHGGVFTISWGTHQEYTFCKALKLPLMWSQEETSLAVNIQTCLIQKWKPLFCILEDFGAHSRSPKAAMGQGLQGCWHSWLLYGTLLKWRGRYASVSWSCLL